LFTIEDYTGSLDLALFGEDYLKHAHFINIGEFLFMKGSLKPIYNILIMALMRITGIPLNDFEL